MKMNSFSFSSLSIAGGGFLGVQSYSIFFSIKKKEDPVPPFFVSCGGLPCLSKIDLQKVQWSPLLDAEPVEEFSHIPGGEHHETPGAPEFAKKEKKRL